MVLQENNKELKSLEQHYGRKLVFEDNFDDACEEVVRQQILSLNLEENIVESKKESNANATSKFGTHKKKLNLNS